MLNNYQQDYITARAEDIREETGMAWELACRQAEREQPFGGRPIGEAFNDPRVPCCGRDAADCDCE